MQENRCDIITKKATANRIRRGGGRRQPFGHGELRPVILDSSRNASHGYELIKEIEAR